MEPWTRIFILTLALCAGALFGAAPARARVLLSQNRALEIAFPDGRYDRVSSFLTEEQASAAEAAARTKLDSKIWTYYVHGSTFAYFDTHRVRTMNETIMVVLGADARVRAVEILSFAEPDDYRASAAWLKQFSDRALNDELVLRRGLRSMTGATLTAEAVSKAVRRVLAVHNVLHPGAAK